MAGRRIGMVAIVGWVAFGLASCAGSPPPAQVPRSVLNAYPDAAISALCAVGLHPSFVGVPGLQRADESINGYAVASASPAPGGEASHGSAVDVRLRVSVNGGGPYGGYPRRSVVPNVVGLDVNDALSGLTRLGLPVNVTVAASTGSLAVTHESPSAGATARRGTAVTLQVGRAGSSGCS